MRLRKLVSVVLVAAMTFALAVPAMAAPSRHTHSGSSSGAQDPRSGTIYTPGSYASKDIAIFGDIVQGPGAGGGVGIGTTGAGGGIGTVYYGWHYVPEEDKWWYEYNDRTWAVGWAKLYWKPWNADQGYEAWYHFDPAGWMDVGWYNDSDNRDYYLHPVADGTRGYMYTGEHVVNGQTYEFEVVEGQYQGHLKNVLR